MQPYEKLEAEFAKSLDLDPERMVACSSGTAALHLALEALRFPARSRVLIPDFTMIACARAAVMADLEPVLVDCDNLLLLDLDLLSKASRLSPKAIMAVHVYGRRIEPGRLAMYADKHGWSIIEDMAELHGVRPWSGTDAACWSFYKNKVIAGEEGGAVFFKSKDAAEFARSLRSLGFTEDHDFSHLPRGHNYRMSNAHASLVLSSLSNLEQNLVIRRQAEARYDEVCPAPWRMSSRLSPWVYDVWVPGLGRAAMKRAVSVLNKLGIAARCGFLPMSFQEEFKGCRRVSAVARPDKSSAALASEEVLYLPIPLPWDVDQKAMRTLVEAVGIYGRTSGNLPR